MLEKGFSKPFFQVNIYSYEQEKMALANAAVRMDYPVCPVVARYQLWVNKYPCNAHTSKNLAFIS